METFGIALVIIGLIVFFAGLGLIMTVALLYIIVTYLEKQ